MDRIISFDDIKSPEEWAELKEDGRAWLTTYLSLGLIILFIFFNALVNFIMLFITDKRLNVYQYLIVFLITPLLLGIINAIEAVHMTWKLNTLIHESREKKIERYKRFYFLNYIVRISTIFLSLVIIFQSMDLFNMNIYQLFQMIVDSILGGTIFGYIYGKRNWNKFNERLTETLKNELM